MNRKDIKTVYKTIEQLKGGGLYGQWFLTAFLLKKDQIHLLDYPRNGVNLPLDPIILGAALLESIKKLDQSFYHGPGRKRYHKNVRSWESDSGNLEWEVWRR